MCFDLRGGAAERAKTLPMTAKLQQSIVCDDDMSIKSKFFISSIIMLVLPVFLMALITVFILVLVASYMPSVSIKISGMEQSYTNPVMQRYILLWIVIFIGVVAGCCVGITAYLSKSILSPLKKMSDAMEHIAKGDLDYEFTCSGDREIKEVYDALDRLRISLKNAVNSEIRREKEYRRLIANISHDLKTPITSIKGYVEGIKDGVANTPEKTERYLSTILLKANALEKMVANLSTYSRLDFENESYNMEKYDLCDFVKETLNEYSIDLRDGEVELEIGKSLISGEPVYAEFDREKLKRVLANVIGNAIKYKKPSAQGKLMADLCRDENGITLSFADNGIGISKEEENKVFETFFRSDPARNLDVSGNGLGLSIADRIVKDHGGKIWMRSNGESGGVTVYIFLPQKKGERYAYINN